MLLSVYVDDNVISAKCPRELKRELNRILKIHPGTIVKTEKKGSGVLRDVLGADFLYDLPNRKLDITMQKYIEKLAEDFRMHGCREVYSPSFSEEELANDNSEPVNFPLRKLVGCLQWVANGCRQIGRAHV